MLLLLQALEYPTHPSLARPGPNKPKIIPKMETRTGASHLAGEQIRVLLSKCPDASARPWEGCCVLKSSIAGGSNLHWANSSSRYSVQQQQAKHQCALLNLLEVSSP